MRTNRRNTRCFRIGDSFLLSAEAVLLIHLDESAEYVVGRALLVSVFHSSASFPVAIVVGAGELDVELRVLSQPRYVKSDGFWEWFSAHINKGSVFTHQLSFLLGLFALHGDAVEQCGAGLCQKLVVEFRRIG